MPYRRTQWIESETSLSAANMNNIEDGVEEALAKAEGNTTLWEYIRNLVYPVGSIYMSASSTNPGELFGGTWVPWGSGRVPVGVKLSDTSFNTVEKTGGSKDAVVVSHNHSASFSGNAVGGHTHNGPSHTHTGPSHTHSGGSIASMDLTKIYTGGDGGLGPRFLTNVGFKSATYNDTGAAGTGNTGAAGTGATSSAGGHTPSGSVSVANTGVTAANRNLQPYITCYMWKRTR